MAMRPASLHLMLAICLSVCMQVQVSADTDVEQGIAVNVQKSGDMMILDVSLTLPVAPHEAWEVLTDYDHMTDFLHNLQFSKIVGGTGNNIQVEQKGRVRFGLLSFPFDTLREVELKPFYEIRSHVIKGNVKRGASTTRLIAEGGGTRLVYHNETESNTWLPAGLGPAIVRGEVRTQFQDLKNEILKRKGEKRQSPSPGQG